MHTVEYLVTLATLCSEIRGRNVSIELKNELKKKDDHLDEVISQQRKLEEEVTKLQFGNSKFVNENNKLMQVGYALF